MLRKIEAVQLDTKVAKPAPLVNGLDDRGNPEPYVEWGDPRDLWVDDEYQRDPTERSLKLVRRVAGGTWDWSTFHPPSVTIRIVDDVERRVILDGQHTAIMAVTRGVARIPWLVSKTTDQQDRAKAFVGQNMDRTGLTTLNKHKARIAAGDEDALTVEQVCARAGVKLWGYRREEWDPCDSMAVGAIYRLVERRFAVHARKVLDVCVSAQLTPITPADIYAVEALLYDDAFEGIVTPETLVDILLTDITLARDASAFAHEKRVPYWRGLTAELYKRAKRRGQG